MPRPSYKSLMSLLPKQTLFYVERSFDTDLVVYEAVRSGNVLLAPFVDLYWTNMDNMMKREAVSQKAQDMFFGFQIKKEGTKYKICIAALPSKVITLHLKKSGAVIPKAIIDGKESTVLRIYVQCTTPKVGIPTVSSLTIYGEHKKLPVSEEVVVTDEMREQFDITSFGFIASLIN